MRSCWRTPCCTIRCRPVPTSIEAASPRFPPACGSRRRQPQASIGTSSARIRQTCPTPSPGLGTVDGLPPTLIVVCEYDDLLPSGTEFAETLELHGVDVTVDVVEGVTHGHLNIPGLPEALTSMQTISDFLTRSA